MRVAGFCLVITLSLAMSGCWPGGRKAPVQRPVAIPPAPAPKQEPSQPAPAVIPVPVAAPVPVVTPAVVTPAVVTPAVVTPSVVTPTPPRAVRKPAPKPPAAALPPSPVTPVSPVAPTIPVPQLGEVLTPVRRREAEAELAASLQRARAALGHVSGRPVTPAQRDTVERIRIFIEQAEKSKDISTAVQLARRADLLGQDLLKTLPQ